MQEWVVRTRRKITSALYNVGEGVHHAPPHDEKVAVAVEAARRKRDEVLATSRELFTRQQEKRSHPAGASANGTQASFDDFLQGDATTGTYTLYNSSAKPAAADQAPRRRNHDDKGLAAKSQSPPSYKDNSGAELLFDASVKNEGQEEQPIRESSATLSANAGRPAHLGSLSGSEPLIRIHSDPPSEASSVILGTPTSTAASVRSLEAEQEPSSQQQPPPASAYFSVNEWAEHISPSFNGTPPRNGSLSLLDHHPDQPPVPASHPTAHPVLPAAPSSSSSSLFDSVEYVRENESVGGGSHDEGRYSDIISETSGMHTPATWTEIGSEVSDGDVGVQ